MIKKTLILVTKEKTQYFPDSCEACELVSLYKTDKIWHRVLRKVLLKIQSPMVSFLFSHWTKIASQADTIIVFDTGNLPEILSWLKKRYPKKRIIVWYWNSVASSIDPKRIKTEGIEIWSFDKHDCGVYGFRFNIQFFIPDNISRINQTSTKEKYDLFYVGADKNRAPVLHELEQALKGTGLTHYFHLVKYKDSTNEFGYEYYQPLIYPEVLSHISNSRAIVDLVAEWQEGITLRPLEALFMGKKLITNMRNIEQYDLYNKSNIFILGKDDLKRLPEFLISDIDKSDVNDLKAKYSIEGWLANFEVVNEE